MLVACSFFLQLQVNNNTLHGLAGPHMLSDSGDDQRMLDEYDYMLETDMRSMHIHTHAIKSPHMHASNAATKEMGAAAAAGEVKQAHDQWSVVMSSPPSRGTPGGVPEGIRSSMNPSLQEMYASIDSSITNLLSAVKRNNKNSTDVSA
jgi:hypothetical protein